MLCSTGRGCANGRWYSCSFLLLHCYSWIQCPIFTSSLGFLAIHLWCRFFPNAFGKTDCRTSICHCSNIFKGLQEVGWAQPALPKSVLAPLDHTGSLECSATSGFIFLLQVNLVKLRMSGVHMRMANNPMVIHFVNFYVRDHKKRLSSLEKGDWDSLKQRSATSEWKCKQQ